VKLYVDDLRPAPDGWELAKSSLEALCWFTMLRDCGQQLEALSLDHDLGGSDTARPLVMWMAQHEWWPGLLYVHSAERVGREWIQRTAERYAPSFMMKTWAQREP
jgi:hypothetical protein